MPSVAIVGASTNAERPSNLAVRRFRARGYTVWPVHPAGHSIDGLPGFRALAGLPGRPDLVCMYVNPETGLGMLDEIVACRPQVLWLNPGADGEPLLSAARARGLRVVEACALVALATGDPLQETLGGGD
ncbi:MAG: CoA-binding protein [Planctomycetes bacterium]|nr:CoA-binding protein [Planctomycetota bacterium]